MPSTTATRLSARERLLAAANELFYEEGVHTVGIDRVIERAGVAKASLYNTFGSKEELIKAYLNGRQVTRRERMISKLARYDDPRDRLLGIFDVLAEQMADSEFRGCAFQRASAEGPADPAITEVCDNSRGWTRSLFTELAADAGATDPAALAERLMLLYDGATVGGQMDRNALAARSAQAVAAVLLDAAIR